VSMETSFAGMCWDGNQRVQNSTDTLNSWWWTLSAVPGRVQTESSAAVSDEVNEPTSCTVMPQSTDTDHESVAAAVDRQLAAVTAVKVRRLIKRRKVLWCCLVSSLLWHCLLGDRKDYDNYRHLPTTKLPKTEPKPYPNFNPNLKHLILNFYSNFTEFLVSFPCW